MAFSLASRVQQLTRELPQPDRYIVLLFFADQLTPTEIALVLDIPVTTVESALSGFRHLVAELSADSPTPTCRSVEAKPQAKVKAETPRARVAFG